MKKVKAFTLVETLLAAGIFGMIVVMGMSIASLVSWTLYTGQTEEVNRTNLNETVYYLTREIQSAEAVKVTDDGKTLEIKERGSSGYNLKYSFVENYPSDYLAFRDKRLLDIKADESRFYFENHTVKATIRVLKNDLDVNQKGRVVNLTIQPRSNFTEEDE